MICIGRNYAKHAKELGNSVPTEPVFFLKPDSAVTREKTLYIPDFTNDLHYEVEVVIKISKIGKNINQEFAHKYYEEIGLGIDFTARDIQLECKEKGLPWEKAKAFDGSALLTRTFISKSDIDLNNLKFSLTKNAEPVQVGNTKDMLFSIDQIIAYVSQFMTLKIGDLIFTGTPEGVGPVTIGDSLEGFIEDKKMFEVRVK